MNRAHGLAVALLGLLFLLIYLTLTRHIAAIQSDARRIDACGLERMRLQRAAFLVTRLATVPAVHRRALQSAVLREASLMQSSWSRLVPPPNRKGPPGRLTARLGHLLAELHIVAAGEGRPAQQAMARRAIRRAAGGALAVALNARVRDYRRLAEHDKANLMVLARDQFILGLGALAALTAFIFVPLSRLTRAEIEKMRDALAYNRTLFDAAPDAIVVIGETGIIEAFNPAAEVLFGMPAEAARGKPVETLMGEPDRSHHADYLKRYRKTGERHVIGQLREVTARRCDGSAVPVELSVGVIAGETRRFVGLLRDLTARKAAEAELEAVRRRYQDLVTNITVGVYRVAAGPPPRFLEINPAMLLLFDAPDREVLLNRSLDTLFLRDEDRALFAASADPAALSVDREIPLRTLAGREFWANIRAVLKSEEGSVYFDGVLEDVTERREAERAVAALNRDLEQRIRDLDVANKELEAFSYSVSHDLRAPLRSIDGFSQALLEDSADKIDDTGQDYLRRVRNASQKMAQLIDDILQLARVTRARLARESVDVSVLSADIARSLEVSDPQRSVEWRIEAGLSVSADPVLLRQVMVNLLGNAWKFTAKVARPVIEVGRTDRKHGPGICVRDNGAGFDPAYADRLFGMFQRLHAAHEFEGTGIGLAIVARIIGRHGGQVYAEARSVRGPLSHSFWGPRGTHVMLPTDRCILLVEDNPDDEALTRRAFAKNNITNPIVVAHDGVEALDYLFHEKIHAPGATGLPILILLDLKFPKIDGLTVLRRLRADPRTKILPVVILTSSGEQQDLVQGYGLGANSYIRKPVAFARFIDAVRQLGLYWLVLNNPPPAQ